MPKEKVIVSFVEHKDIAQYLYEVCPKMFAKSYANCIEIALRLKLPQLRQEHLSDKPPRSISLFFDEKELALLEKIADSKGISVKRLIIDILKLCKNSDCLSKMSKM